MITRIIQRQRPFRFPPDVWPVSCLPPLMPQGMNHTCLQSASPSQPKPSPHHPLTSTKLPYKKRPNPAQYSTPCLCPFFLSFPLTATSILRSETTHVFYLPPNTFGSVDVDVGVGWPVQSTMTLAPAQRNRIVDKDTIRQIKQIKQYSSLVFHSQQWWKLCFLFFFIFMTGTVFEREAEVGVLDGVVWAWWEGADALVVEFWEDTVSGRRFQAQGQR